MLMRVNTVPGLAYQDELDETITNYDFIYIKKDVFATAQVFP